jgi:hypothetical protein
MQIFKIQKEGTSGLLVNFLQQAIPFGYVPRPALF